MAKNSGEFVQLGASNDQLKAKLRETTTLFQGSAAEWQRALDGVGERGAHSLESFEKSVKGLARTMKSEGRMVGFMTRDLLEVSGAGKEAKEVLNGLIGGGFALASGNPVIAGIEMLRTATALLGKVGEESEKAIEKSNKVIEPILRRWEDRVRSLGRELAVLNGGKGAGNAVDLVADVRTTQAEIKKLQEHADNDIMFPWQRDRVRNEIAQKQRELLEQIRKAGEANRLQKEVDDKRAEEEELRREREKHDKLLEEQRKYQEAYLKAQREFSLSGWQATKGVDLSRSQGGVLNLKENSAAGQGFDANKTPNVYNLMNEQGGSGNRFDPEQLRKTNEDLKKQQMLLEEGKKKWGDYASKIGESLVEVAQGHKKLGDVVKSVLKDLLTALIQYALKWILAQAGISAANTESQMSSQGPYGWLVGLGAMAAVFAAVMGMGDKLGTAEQGAELPNFSGTRLYGLHSEELVLPRYYKKGLKDLIDSRSDRRAEQSPAAPTVQFNGNFPNVYDERGFERTLQRFERKYIEFHEGLQRDRKI